MAPMTRQFSPNGVPDAQVGDYYRRRAEGGVGLILTEGTTVPHGGASSMIGVPGFHGDALEGWQKIAEAVHCRWRQDRTAALACGRDPQAGNRSQP